MSGFVLSQIVLSPRMFYIVMVALMVLIVVLGAVAFVLLFLNKRSLAQGKKALADGRFQEALEAYKAAAKGSFTGDFFNLSKDAPETFFQALAGIQEVYRRAGRAVDLNPLLQLKQQHMNEPKADINDPGFQARVEHYNNETARLLAALPRVG